HGRPPGRPFFLLHPKASGHARVIWAFANEAAPHHRSLQMTTLKLATLLMIGATLAATPALAQALTAGNKGPSELPPTRSAPLNLPATTPTPMPKVDTSILGRDIFGLDPALLLESLGTVTLDR